MGQQLKVYIPDEAVIEALQRLAALRGIALSKYMNDVLTSHVQTVGFLVLAICETEESEDTEDVPEVLSKKQFKERYPDLKDSAAFTDAVIKAFREGGYEAPDGYLWTTDELQARKWFLQIPE